MKKILYIIVALCSTLSTPTTAQEYLYLYQNNLVKSSWDISVIDSITFSDNQNQVVVHQVANTQAFAITDIDSLTFASSAVYITYGQSDVSVVNPFVADGVVVTTDGANVVVNAEVGAKEVTYVLSGSSNNGSFKLYSNYKVQLVLNNLTLTNSVGPALNIQSSKSCAMVVNGTNTLADGTPYNTSTEDQKGTIFSEGQIKFSGTGTLSVAGNNRHAICSDDYISIGSGTILITKAANDGINANDYFEMSGGSLTISNTNGDGIDAGKGYFTLNGGDIAITSTAADVKGIKGDSTITVNGGKIVMSVSGNQSKGIKPGLGYFQNGGEVVITTTGDVVVTNGDPSYCTAIKCDQHFNMTSGTLTINSSGKGGKGVSADGDIRISGGTIEITTTGSGTTYTNTSGVTDSYSSTCLTSDGNSVITAGKLTLKSTGAGGKCISSDGSLTLGASGESNENLQIAATTTGTKFLVVAGTNPDYNNPKAIKCDGNMDIYSGTFTVRCANDGGEGFESKAIFTVHGGMLDIETYDDGINAGSAIVVNGGYIYSKASNNDGIDSNGTLTINGGIVIASGAASPEASFDSDRNSFVINGGILIGTGGSSSSPTSAPQSYILSNSTALSQGKYLQLVNSSGVEILSYLIPRTINSGTVLISAPGITKSSSYTLKYGGSYSGGTEIWKGYTTGGSYSSGSSKSVTGR